MKKIIGIVIASLMISNIGFAEISTIEQTHWMAGNYMISTVCVDGYKFVFWQNTEGNVSMTQFFKHYEAIPGTITTIPAKCF